MRVPFRLGTAAALVAGALTAGLVAPAAAAPSAVSESRHQGKATPVVLQYIHKRSRIALVLLTSATGAPADLVVAHDPRTYADLTSSSGLKTVARYATWLGPDESQIVPLDPATGRMKSPTSLIADAHRAGLKIVPYTFRNENEFLPADFDRGSDPADYGDALAEDRLFYSLGIDGIFTDNADTAVLARQQWVADGRPRQG